MFESPYEEGKYIHFISPTGSYVFLFKGGLVKLPLVNRENAEILEFKKIQESCSEFGIKDSVFFRETLFLNTNIRFGYDNVRSVDVEKFEEIINSIKIQADQGTGLGGSRDRSLTHFDKTTTKVTILNRVRYLSL